MKCESFGKRAPERWQAEKKNSNIDNCPRSFIRQNVVEVVVAKKILMANIVIAGDFAALPVDRFFSHSALIFAFSFNFNFHFDS